MPIVEIESNWRETLLHCPECDGVIYTDGVNRPTCEHCYRQMTDQEIWTWLIVEEECLNP